MNAVRQKGNVSCHTGDINSKKTWLSVRKINELEIVLSNSPIFFCSFTERRQSWPSEHERRILLDRKNSSKEPLSRYPVLYTRLQSLLYFNCIILLAVLEDETESIELFIQFLFSVYGGEVDCFQTSNDGAHYVELKTSRVIETEKQDVNFRRYVRQLE